MSLDTLATRNFPLQAGAAPMAGAATARIPAALPLMQACTFRPRVPQLLESDLDAEIACVAVLGYN